MSPSTTRLNPTADLPRSPRAARRHQRGFTIIEALIATAILSASVGVIFAVQSNALLVMQLAAERSAARLHLESLLAESGAAAPLAIGETSGSFDDRFSWRVSVTPYTGRGAEARMSVTAVSVTASVAWRSRGADRALTLTTVRLQGAPP